MSHGIQKTTDFALLLDLIPGKERSGSLVGMWVAAEKLGSVLGSVLFGQTIQLFFRSGLAREEDTLAACYTRMGYICTYTEAGVLMVASALVVKQIRQSPRHQPESFVVTGGYFDGSSDGFLGELKAMRDASGTITGLEVVSMQVAQSKLLCHYHICLHPRGAYPCTTPNNSNILDTSGSESVVR